MSDDHEAIICRQCNEAFPVSEGDCPKCGTPVRDERKLGVVVAIGLVVVALAVYSGQIALTAIAVLFTAAIGYLIYDKRNRIERARKRRTSEESGGSTAE